MGVLLVQSPGCRDPFQRTERSCAHDRLRSCAVSSGSKRAVRTSSECLKLAQSLDTHLTSSSSSRSNQATAPIVHEGETRCVHNKKFGAYFMRQKFSKVEIDSAGPACYQIEWPLREDATRHLSAREYGVVRTLRPAMLPR